MTISQPLTFEELFGAPKPATLEGLRALGIRGMVFPGVNSHLKEEDIVEAVIEALVGHGNNPNPEEMELYYDPDQSPYKAQ